MKCATRNYLAALRDSLNVDRAAYKLAVESGGDGGTPRWRRTLRASYEQMTADVRRFRAALRGAS